MDLPYRLGAKPSRPDSRDFKFAAKPLAASAALLDRKFYSMVSKDFRISQGNEGTCTGHGDTNLLLAGPSVHPTFPDFQTEELAHEFSRSIYFEATGDSTYQNGAYPRDVHQVLKNRDLIESYWNVVSVDDVITYLLTTGPVGIAVPWYYSMFFDWRFYSKVYGNWYIKTNLESELVGYHWIIATGVDMNPDDGCPPWIRIQNSWGTWGFNGTGRLLVESFRRLNIYDNWTFVEKEF